MTTKDKPKDAEKELFTDDNRCKDYDEDCPGLRYTACWLYDPEQGWCPFLINKKDTER